jgi:hypothetical protein
MVRRRISRQFGSRLHPMRGRKARREDCIAPFVGGHDDVVVAQSQVHAGPVRPRGERR